MHLFTLLLFSVCARRYKKGLSMLFLTSVSVVLGYNFLVFGNVIKGTIPMLVLFLYSFVVACCWRRVR